MIRLTDDEIKQIVDRQYSRIKLNSYGIKLSELQSAYIRGQINCAVYAALHMADQKVGKPVNSLRKPR